VAFYYFYKSLEDFRIELLIKLFSYLKLFQSINSIKELVLIKKYSTKDRLLI